MEAPYKGVKRHRHVGSQDAPINGVVAKSAAAKIMVATLVACPEPGTSKKDGFVGMLPTRQVVARKREEANHYERVESSCGRKGYVEKLEYEEGKARLSDY